MHLTAIRLRGFKSFPDPVEIRLEPGVGVIVAPNGFGKSNAADAIALGSTQRRAKQKRAARESLQAALAIFEELGAGLWAEKARAELARIGGRAPAPGELTATERRVAELVAEGRSNKEVAAELFVAVRTVESHLTRVYEKLGVGSRAELARRLAIEEVARLRT